MSAKLLRVSQRCLRIVQLGMNTVTRDGLEATVQAAVGPLTEKLDRLLHTQGQPVFQPTPPLPAERCYIVSCIALTITFSTPTHGQHYWGGRHRRVPEDFIVPRVSTQIAFQLWHLGDPANKFPPLCTIESLDVGDDKGGVAQINKRRRFANLRSLMRQFDAVRGATVPLGSTNAVVGGRGDARQATGHPQSQPDVQLSGEGRPQHPTRHHHGQEATLRCHALEHCPS